MNINNSNSNLSNEEQNKSFENINKQLDELSFDIGRTKLNSDTTSLKSFSSDNSDNLTDTDYFGYHKPIIVKFNLNKFRSIIF